MSVYKVNGTELTLQPTTGRWLPRPKIGTSGTGHGVYPNVREFEITWQLMSPSEVNQIVGFFDSVGVTGTAVTTLPQYGASTYTFFDYSGCVVNEPEINNYYVGHQTQVVLLVSNIRT